MDYQHFLSSEAAAAKVVFDVAAGREIGRLDRCGIAAKNLLRTTDKPQHRVGLPLQLGVHR
jgi:hypothetical protein